MKRAIILIGAALTLRGADTLDSVLNRMDQASKTFTSMSADVRAIEYSNLFEEMKPEDGTFRMMKKGKSGVVLLAEFTGKDARKIHLSNGKAQVYHPKANSVDIYETKHFAKSADLLILVGFGTSREELQNLYTVSLGPSETVGGKKTTRIDLKPKSSEKENFFNAIQLWIPEDAGNPVQEKILKGTDNKDYNLLQFSNLKLPAPAGTTFELKLPPGVKLIYAGK